jgi:hypothetical protein
MTVTDDGRCATIHDISRQREDEIVSDVVCPNCSHPLTVAVYSAGKKIVKAERAVLPTWSRPLMAYVSRQKPGRYSNMELYRGFSSWALTQNGVNTIPTPPVLGKILASWGYERYRTATERGFIIDGPRRVVSDENGVRVISPEAEPA